MRVVTQAFPLDLSLEHLPLLELLPDELLPLLFIAHDAAARSRFNLPLRRGPPAGGSVPQLEDALAEPHRAPCRCLRAGQGRAFGQFFPGDLFGRESGSTVSRQGAPSCASGRGRGGAGGGNAGAWMLSDGPLCAAAFVYTARPAA